MDDDDDNPYNTAPSSSSSSKKKAQKQALKASFQNPTTFKTPANGVGGGEGYFLDDEEDLPDPVFDNAIVPVAAISKRPGLIPITDVAASSSASKSAASTPAAPAPAVSVVSTVGAKPKKKSADSGNKHLVVKFNSKAVPSCDCKDCNLPGFGYRRSDADFLFGGSTRLIRSVEKELIHYIELLIVCNIKLNQTDREGFTALITACSLGHDHIVTMLLDAGADTTIFNKNGCDAVMEAIGTRHTYCAYLVLKAAGPAYKEFPTLDLAVADGSVVLVRELLERASGGVTFTPAFFSERAAKALVALDQSSSCPNCPGCSLRKVSISACLFLLLRAGGEVPPECREQYWGLGKSSCALPGCGEEPEEGFNFDQCSACQGVRYCCREHQRQHWKEHKHICPDFKAPVLAAAGKLPGLHQMLVDSNYCDMVLLGQLLLQPGRVDERNDRDATPLTVEMGNQNLRRLAMVRFLVALGADVNHCGKSKLSATPLMLCCSLKAPPLRVVQFLLARGADPNLPSPERRTAMSVAYEKRDAPDMRAITALFVQHGGVEKDLSMTPITASEAARRLQSRLLKQEAA